MLEQATPDDVVVRKAQLQEVAALAHPTQQADEGEPRKLFTPGHRCTAHESRGIGVAARELP